MKKLGKILSEILGKLSNLDDKVSNLDDKVSKLDDKVSKLDDKVSKLDDKVSKLDDKVSKLEARVSIVETKVDEVYSLKGKIEESHQWLGVLYHNSLVHKAEVDQLNHRVTVVEGALSGAAKSLEPLKKAQ